MKKAKLNYTNFIALVEERYVKVGRYWYNRIVDEHGISHFYRHYRKGDDIVCEEVNPFR